MAVLPADLLEATGRLLTAIDWRQRLVEKMAPESAAHYELRRSFQFEIPSALMEGIDCPGGQVPVLLPVCWLAKETLVDFDVTDASGKTLSVLERRSIAGVVSQILDSWRTSAPELVGVGLSLDRVESIVAASLTPWRLAQYRASTRDPADALFHYLSEHTGVQLAPWDLETMVNTGRSLAQQAYELLEREWVRHELDNVATNGALLLPYLEVEPRDEVTLKQTIRGHERQIRALINRASESDEVLSWLWILIEAGVRWPVLVPYAAPLDEPFMVKTREIRPSGDDRPRVFRHLGELRDCRSYHLHMPAPDRNVRVAKWKAASDLEHGEEYGAPATFENVKLTQELFAVYTSLPERPDRVWMHVTYGLVPTAWLPYAFAYAFVVAALVAVWLVDVDGATGAVLTIPPALVGAFLVTQDSPLVARFLFPLRLAMVLFNVTLWVIVLWKLVVADDLIGSTAAARIIHG